MLVIVSQASQQVGASQPADKSPDLAAYEIQAGPVPATPNMTGSVSADAPLQSRSASDGLFYVTAMVNGKPVRFVVDTGASVVILTQSDAARAGVVSGTDRAIDVETAGGSSAMHSVSLGRVDIAGQSLTDVDAAVMSSDLPVSLLGQSVLSQMRSVRLSGNRLQLN